MSKSSVDNHMPLLRGPMLAALEAYQGNGNDSPSVYMLWLHLPEMEKTLRKINKKVDLKRTCTLLASGSHETLHLLMAIPPLMMQALLKQTVGIVFHRKGAAIPSVKGAPGIYVTTLEVEDRRGKFLSRREIARAIKHLEAYAGLAPHLNRFHEKRPDCQLRDRLSSVSDCVIEAGFDLGAFLADYGKHFDDVPEPSSQGSDASFATDRATPAIRECIQKAVDFVWAIDNAPYAKKQGNAQWDTHSKGCRLLPWLEDQQHGTSRLKRLCAMLKRRLGRSVDAVLAGSDQGDDEPLWQTPLYIGCANSLPDRMGVYSLSRDIQYINSHLKMLVCVIMHMGLGVELVPRVVLRTWTAEQLPVAERLVITIARSLVWQDGLNSEEGGGNPGKSTGGRQQDAKEWVLARNEVYQSNLAMTELEVDEYVMAAEEAEETVNLLDDLVDKARDMSESVERCQTEVNSAGSDAVGVILSTAKAMEEDERESSKTISQAIELIKLLSY